MWLSRRKIKKRITFDVQQGRCWLCTLPMQMSDPSRDDYATWDEITPRSRGGHTHKANQALAHAKCNRVKGSDLPTQKQLENLRSMRRSAVVVD